MTLNDLKLKKNILYIFYTRGGRGAGWVGGGEGGQKSYNRIEPNVFTQIEEFLSRSIYK